MVSIFEHKSQLRQQMRHHKRQVDAEAAALAAQGVFSEVEMLEAFRQADTVLAFWSLPDELPTHRFVLKWSGSKRMVLPVVVGSSLELRLFEGVEQLEQSNRFGIMEPKTGTPVSPADIEFAIIPGVAFDRKGNRLGRGKGFYDRLMPQLSSITKAGVGYGFQLVETVPVDEFDSPVDVVICK